MNRLNQKSPTTIIDMKSAYEKVKEKDDITLNQDYERLTSSTYKYKLWEKKYEIKTIKYQNWRQYD